MQRSQSKILRMITNAPWYVTNQTLHDDLKVPFIKDVIQEISINHHDKLENHSNPILQPLLEQQQRRRLKKLWPADLTDGWGGFTHWSGPHHDTIGTGGRCLTQHISLKDVLNSDCYKTNKQTNNIHGASIQQQDIRHEQPRGFSMCLKGTDILGLKIWQQLPLQLIC
jgi:hypothetical protein